MKCAMSCMAFQPWAPADPRRRGYLLPPFGGHRRELHGGGEIQRLGSGTGSAPAIEQAALTPLAFWNAPIWV
ncbi:MAG: hypothetical protein ACLSTO_00115 [Bilophila wadsworthia]